MEAPKSGGKEENLPVKTLKKEILICSSKHSFHPTLFSEKSFFSDPPGLRALLSPGAALPSRWARGAAGRARTRWRGLLGGRCFGATVLGFVGLVLENGR